MGTSGSGTITLELGHSERSTAAARTVRLEVSADGKALVLVDTETRKTGSLREFRYEITVPELIAFVRAHGVELHGELAMELHHGLTL